MCESRSPQGEGEEKTRIIAPGLSAPGLATRIHGLFLNYRRAKSLSELTPERAYGAQGVVAARSLDAHDEPVMHIQD